MGVMTATNRGVSTDTFRRAKVLSVDDEGLLTITAGDETSAFAAELLHTFEGPPLQLVPGDEVLVGTPSDGSRAVVLGRLKSAVRKEARVPDELVIEAKKGLVLRVGEGSITLRADGKILIQGNDLVSQAKRMNRIKGGAVSIN
jgi:hypothetical protein